VESRETVAVTTIARPRQKPALITVGSREHAVAVICFALFVVKLGVCDSTIKLKNSFVNGSTVFKLESIKLHQESNNHSRAKCIIKAKAEPLTNPAHKIIDSMRFK
jgi:hypothetical protein